MLHRSGLDCSRLQWGVRWSVVFQSGNYYLWTWLEAQVGETGLGSKVGDFIVALKSKFSSPLVSITSSLLPSLSFGRLEV